MISKCSIKEKDTILAYIGEDYPSCLYLYLNLNKYGFCSDVVDVFLQMEAERITAVLLRYYSCLHVYSKDNSFHAEELTAFIESSGVSMVYCTALTANRIFDKLPHQLQKHAFITHGWVAQIKSVDHISNGFAVPAKAKDFNQIARLIFDDEDIGRSYRFDELARQLEERNRDGYARNLVIKQDDSVIAHACTAAEYKSIAVVAELLVRKEFRRKGYATDIWRDLCKTLLDEGKEVFSFYYSEESRKLHQKIGFFEICEWGKIVFSRVT